MPGEFGLCAASDCKAHGFCAGDGCRGRFGSVPSPVVVQTGWHEHEHEHDTELQSLSEDFVAKPVRPPNPWILCCIILLFVIPFFIYILLYKSLNLTSLLQCYFRDIVEFDIAAGIVLDIAFFKKKKNYLLHLTVLFHKAHGMDCENVKQAFQRRVGGSLA